MINPEVEHRIQPRPDVGGPPIQDLTLSEERRQRTIAKGTAFGAFVGLLMGAVIGATCCWLTGQFDFLVYGVSVGIVTGPFVGAFIGLTERKVRGDLARPDTATIIGVVFGLFPGILMGVQGLSGVKGRLSAYLLLGAFCAGPMGGLVIGGILDRAFEESLKKRWGVSAIFALLGVAVCIGLIYLFDSLAYGPDPNEVARKARSVISSKWSENPKFRDATIEKTTLQRKGRTTYIGFADVTLAGQRERLNLEVRAQGEMVDVNWTVAPSKDGPQPRAE